MLQDMKRFLYFALALFLFCFLNFSHERMNALRARVAAVVSPLWQTGVLQAGEPPNVEEAELYLLRSQIEELKNLFAGRVVTPSARAAKVLFRDPSLWSSSIWISLGEIDNRERIVIAKNSPVLLGNSLLGVVEYVGETQSRVRLITDAGLTSAVRAVRGGKQNSELLNQLEILTEQLRARTDLFFSSEEQEKFLSGLSLLQERLAPAKEELLAKGELRGQSSPLWAGYSPTLTGIGFNYDFADEVGPARDLHAGNALLQKGDLLVTSGFDGIFPPGIPVAIVTSVDPLKEGSYSYSLQAKPTAGTLQDLRVVFVLPPTDL